jgi:hypothetical protein
MDESSENKNFLDKVKPDRRRFVQVLLGASSFAAPVIRSFVMTSAATELAPDVYATPNVTTTAAPTTTTTTTTPAPPPNLVYIADNQNNRIRMINGAGDISTIAGNGVAGFSGDGGPATSAELHNPYGVAADSAGNIYIADTQNNRIRKVAGGIITTVAGNGAPSFSGDGGLAVSAGLNNPTDVAVDILGNIYIADQRNNRIRMVSTAGIISTVAGDGVVGYAGDGGLATSAALYYPTGVAVDQFYNIYIADSDNQRVRMITYSTGIITTVAGNGNVGYSTANGPATSIGLHNPTGVAVNGTGSFFIADYGNQCIREVTAGISTTVAGNGTASFSGDGGPATSAELNYPTDVTLDGSGNLYIADYVNNRIRGVSSGTITTLAGKGTPGFSGDGGPATSAQLYNPSGVVVTNKTGAV